MVNYRCFKEKEVEFSVPDGSTPGSGLNILLGENANGKTTVLEAVNMLTTSSYMAEGKLDILDFNDLKTSIQISAKVTPFRKQLHSPYQGNFLTDTIQFSCKSRDRKAPGKLLSSPFQANSVVIPSKPTYDNKDGSESGKPIPPLDLNYSNSDIIDGDLNIFMFDKGRTRQLTTGTYKTTFQRICADLNWKFLKSLDDETAEKLANEVSSDYFKAILEIAQKGTGKKLADEISAFFDDPDLKNLRMDLFSLSHPFSEAFFAIRETGSLKQIRSRELGSGVEMILSLLLLKMVSGESKGSLIYLIDEPEIHLHPKAQELLFDLLLEESKDKQIIFTTHSPWLFKLGLNSAAGIKILSKNANKEIEITDARAKTFGKFPWSPSWGEITFSGYNLPTVDYHNELYGFIQNQFSLNNEKAMEDWLNQKGVPFSKAWIREKAGVPQPPNPVSLCSYIRNCIHHPENRHNVKFTEAELTQSIQTLNSVF